MCYKILSFKKIKPLKVDQTTQNFMTNKRTQLFMRPDQHCCVWFVLWKFLASGWVYSVVEFVNCANTMKTELKGHKIHRYRNFIFLLIASPIGVGWSAHAREEYDTSLQMVVWNFSLITSSDYDHELPHTNDQCNVTLILCSLLKRFLSV